MSHIKRDCSFFRESCPVVPINIKRDAFHPVLIPLFPKIPIYLVKLFMIFRQKLNLFNEISSSTNYVTIRFVIQRMTSMSIINEILIDSLVYKYRRNWSFKNEYYNKIRKIVQTRDTIKHFKIIFF